MKEAVKVCERPADPLQLADQVNTRLEEAGMTLLALPGCNRSSVSDRLRSGHPEIVHAATEAYGYTGATLRPAAPSPAAIERMDEAFAWLSLISDPLVRRVVSARCLVRPLDMRHVFTWRRLGQMLSLDHRLVQRRHADGIAAIAARARFNFTH